MKEKRFSTGDLIKIALLSVIAVLLMQYGAIKLPMLFPSFLEVDFSEMPAIVGILTINPLAGLLIVIMKNLLKVLIFGSSTGYVGELSNMLISIGYILPLMWMCRKEVHLKNTITGIGLGVISMALVGGFVNYFITLPLYAAIMVPMETIVEMGHAIFPMIKDSFTLVLFSIVPFNIFKGIIVAIVSGVVVKANFTILLRLKKYNE